jgi:hypothetical protein
MAQIGITLNEVIRDYVGQLKYVYKKYYGEDLEDVKVEDFDLASFFKFDSQEAFHEFLYSESPMEIFAHADQSYKNVGPILNSFINDINDYEEHEVILLSRDVHKSRPATLFFLSKLGFTGNSIKFVLDTKKLWDDVDVLVTANPVALDSKPEGKISVKIEATYNENTESDYTLESILDFINNEEQFKKIMNND